jgi:hypothetical protein
MCVRVRVIGGSESMIDGCDAGVEANSQTGRDGGVTMDESSAK